MGALLASISQANTEIKIKPTDSSGDEALLDILRFVSARVEVITARIFSPDKRTRRFHAFGSHIDDAYNALYLGSLPILEIQSLVIGGVTLAPYNEEDQTGDYFFLEDESPYFNICLSVNAQARWSDLLNGDWRNSIRVTGTWGYRSRYPAESWQLAAATLSSDLNNSNKTVNVSSLASFSPGQRVRIGDEYMDIENVDTGLTVIRGAGGTSAAAHSSGAAIDIWIPEPPITRAVLRWSAFLYKRRGQFDKLSLDAVTGTIVSQYPPDAPEEVQNILDLYTDWTPRVVE